MDDRKIQSQGQFLSISGFNARGTLSILVSITPLSLNFMANGRKQIA